MSMRKRSHWLLPSPKGSPVARADSHRPESVKRLVKKSMELCILYEGKAAVRSSYKTDAGGRARLCANLEASDTVAIEACALAFVLARRLERDAGCHVLVLNPGKLAIIWQSTRKTDKEDARKLA